MGDAEVTAPADAHQIERPSGFLDRHLWKAIIVGRLSLCQLEDPCPCKEPCLEIGSVDMVRPIRDPIQHIACARPDQADGLAGRRRWGRVLESGEDRSFPSFDPAFRHPRTIGRRPAKGLGNAAIAWTPAGNRPSTQRL